MKISIENFKSIKKLHNFEIKPLTILSGVNSAGKSSFVQLLLILKQTIKANNEPLKLDSEFYAIQNYIDIVSQKDLEKKVKIVFQFSKYEFSQISNIGNLSLFNTFSNYNCSIELEYDYNAESNSPFISTFAVDFTFENNDPHSIRITNIEKEAKIETNSLLFGKELKLENVQITDIIYISIYPDKYEQTDNQRKTINLDGIKNLMNSFFNNISYLKPNRENPKDFYPSSNNLDNVGTKGQYTAQILEEKAKEECSYFKIDTKEDGIVYNVCETTLAEAVKYWMCDVFEVAENIIAEREKETYKIILTNKSGLKTSIKHVGFGISQLLPIIVEGLRMPKNGTLIIEQPEIHLHPKLQSKLYDFLYGLTKQGKKVIVETHSSHFITRMRRRIAEDETNEMDNQIGLTFIEGNIFRSIALDDYGTMDYYPDDFIEESNAELRAIVKAQMKKRKRNAKS